jgi:parallel beta-helix repeat protein
VYNQNKDKYYITIHDAISDASSGDTIKTAAWTFIENIVIDKTLTIIGKDKDTTTIDGGYSGDVVHISNSADWVNISGFKITNSGSGGSPDYDAGIDIRSDRNNVSYCKIDSNHRWGIYIHSLSQKNEIFDNIISGNGYGGATQPIDGGGVLVYQSDDNKFKSNTISSNEGIGIYFSSTSINNLTSETIYMNYGGIYIYDSTDNDIYKCNILDNGWDEVYSTLDNGGIKFVNSHDNKIIQSTISGNYEYQIKIDSSSTGNTIDGNLITGSMAGVIVDPSNNNTISNNLILNCGCGIKILDSDLNNLVNNILINNDIGIYIDADSNDNSIYYNDFINNDIHAVDEGDNTWDDGAGTGNYWDDYNGKDKDNDGIGDTKLPHYGLDYCPVMVPIRNVPPIADAGGPYLGYQSKEIIFDASGSYDFNGDTLEYRWDFDNDGVWDTGWSFNPTATHTWNNDYTGMAAVEVSDGEYTTTDVTIVTIITLEITLDVSPDALNLKSNGNWISAYIELPEGYDVNDIDISTILLNDKIPAESQPTVIGDYDNDGIPDLMVKFDRAAVQEILEVGDSEKIVVTGRLHDGTSFGGMDVIKVIDNGK